MCIFCDQTRKKVKGVEQKLVTVQTENFEDDLRKCMALMDDERLKTRLASTDFAAKEVKYHATCRISS